MEKVHTSMENSTDYLKCGMLYQTKSNNIDTKKEPASCTQMTDIHRLPYFFKWIQMFDAKHHIHCAHLKQKQEKKKML